VHHDRRLGDAEAGAAIGLRDADAEPAVVGERAIELLGEFAVAVARQPIVVGKPRADLLDRGADRLLQLRKGEIDGGYSGANIAAALAAAARTDRYS
jgi:hypothetical protein